MFNDPVIIQSAAARFQLPPLLITAVIDQESGGDEWAWNPEPHYRYLWNIRVGERFRPLTQAERASETPPADFPCYAGDRDQEWWGQQASWGLMQVMGAVARERGFGGNYLPALLEPRINLDIGCMHLAHLARRHLRARGWAGVLAAWNTGSPDREPGSAGEKYSREVMNRLPKGAKL